jgi:hypothetical protein
MAQPFSVIPGRAEGANPQSSNLHSSEGPDSGSPLRGVRNDAKECHI